MDVADAARVGSRPGSCGALGGERSIVRIVAETRLRCRGSKLLILDVCDVIVINDRQCCRVIRGSKLETVKVVDGVSRYMTWSNLDRFGGRDDCKMLG